VLVRSRVSGSVTPRSSSGWPITGTRSRRPPSCTQSGSS
jgi:hypothetical protein